MELGLKGKSVLVTGGSRGIGRHIALDFAREGANVAICARDPQKIQSTLEELKALGVRAHGIAADLCVPDVPRRVVDEAAEFFGQLNVLINNAGDYVKKIESIETVSESVLFQRVNGKGYPAVACAKAAIRHLRDAGWGRIIFMGGTSSRNLLRASDVPDGSSGMAQGLANSMISNFAKHLSIEVARYNIRVNVVHPHFVKTDEYEKWEEFFMVDKKLSREDAAKYLCGFLPINRLVDPADVAAAVVFLASERTGSMTGQAIAVDGGAGGHITY